MNVDESSYISLCSPQGIDAERKKLRKSFNLKIENFYYTTILKKSFSGWRNQIHIKVLQKNNDMLAQNYYAQVIAHKYFSTVKKNWKMKGYRYLIKHKTFQGLRKNALIGRMIKMQNNSILKKSFKGWKFIHKAIVAYKKAYGFRNRLLAKRTLKGLKFIQKIRYRIGKRVLIKHKHQLRRKYFQKYRLAFKYFLQEKQLKNKIAKTFFMYIMPIVLQKWRDYVDLNNLKRYKIINKLEWLQKYRIFAKLKRAISIWKNEYSQKISQFHQKWIQNKGFLLFKIAIDNIIISKQEYNIKRNSFKKWIQFMKIRKYRRKNILEETIFYKHTCFAILKTHYAKAILFQKKQKYLQTLCVQRYFKNWKNKYELNQSISILRKKSEESIRKECLNCLLMHKTYRLLKHRAYLSYSKKLLNRSIIGLQFHSYKKKKSKSQLNTSFQFYHCHILHKIFSFINWYSKKRKQNKSISFQIKSISQNRIITKCFGILKEDLQIKKRERIIFQSLDSKFYRILLSKGFNRFKELKYMKEGDENVEIVKKMGTKSINTKSCLQSKSQDENLKKTQKRKVHFNLPIEDSTEETPKKGGIESIDPNKGLLRDCLDLWSMMVIYQKYLREYSFKSAMNVLGFFRAQNRIFTPKLKIFSENEGIVASLKLMSNYFYQKKIYRTYFLILKRNALIAKRRKRLIAYMRKKKRVKLLNNCLQSFQNRRNQSFIVKTMSLNRYKKYFKALNYHNKLNKRYKLIQKYFQVKRTAKYFHIIMDLKNQIDKYREKYKPIIYILQLAQNKYNNQKRNAMQSIRSEARQKRVQIQYKQKKAESFYRYNLEKKTLSILSKKHPFFKIHQKNENKFSPESKKSHSNRKTKKIQLYNKENQSNFGNSIVTETEKRMQLLQGLNAKEKLEDNEQFVDQLIGDFEKRFEEKQREIISKINSCIYDSQV